MLLKKLKDFSAEMKDTVQANGQWNSIKRKKISNPGRKR